MFNFLYMLFRLILIYILPPIQLISRCQITAFKTVAKAHK